MSLTVVLNGHTRDFGHLPQPVSLAQLIADLALKGDRVAVELNGVIVERSRWRNTIMSSDDRLEVVHFVGGGTAQFM